MNNAGSMLTLDELTAAVRLELATLRLEQPNGQVSSTPDARTLRYYSSLGLLDPPARVRGRRSLYIDRHILQAVAVKTLQAQGLPLGEIQLRLTGRSDSELEAVIARPSGARFWRRPAAASAAAPPQVATVAATESAPPVEAGPGALVEPTAIRLAPGLTLIIDGPTSPSAEDLDALRTASGELIEQARRSNLIDDSQETR